MIKILITFTFILLNTSQASAWDITRLKGDVKIKRAETMSLAQENSQLELNDLIITGLDSRVQLTEGTSTLSLGSRSKFKITETSSNSNAKKILNIISGKLRASIHGSTAKDYKYKTPAAVSGVRGTEFFIAVDENQDTICTLDGAVEVESQNGDIFVVNKGQGLALKPGDKPQISDNSTFLVDQWVAETSFDTEGFVATQPYSNPLSKHNYNQSKWFYGGYANAFYCNSDNRDFNKNNSDPKYGCFRSYFSPLIQYGVNNKIFFRPAILTIANERKTQIDEMPITNEKATTQLTLAELYGEQIKENWSYKLGFQNIEWADGVFLSNKSWSPEPVTHLALTVKTKIADWQYELLYSPGYDDESKLKGHSHIGLTGVKIDLPKKIGSFYTLIEDYGDLEVGQSPLYHGHEILNYGFYSTQKIKNYDYSFSSIYQKHHIHHDIMNMVGKTEGGMLDVSLGRHLQAYSAPLRLSVRYMRASKDFVPGAEDYYLLGASNFVAARANLEQRRIKLEWAKESTHSISLEYISNYEVDDDGFIRQLSTTGDDQAIGEELDIVYRYQFPSNLRLFAGLWSFNPSANHASQDSATGEFMRAEYTY